MPNSSCHLAVVVVAITPSIQVEISQVPAGSFWLIRRKRHGYPAIHGEIWPCFVWLPQTGSRRKANLEQNTRKSGGSTHVRVCLSTSKSLSTFTTCFPAECTSLSKFTGSLLLHPGVACSVLTPDVIFGGVVLGKSARFHTRAVCFATKQTFSCFCEPNGSTFFPDCLGVPDFFLKVISVAMIFLRQPPSVNVSRR